MSREMSVKRVGSQSKERCPERKKMEKDLEELSEVEEVPKKNSKLSEKDMMEMSEEMDENFEEESAVDDLADLIDVEGPPRKNSIKSSVKVVPKKALAKAKPRPMRVLPQKNSVKEEVVPKKNHKAPAMKAPSKDSIEDLVESEEESGFDLESSDVDDKPMKQLAPKKRVVEEDIEESDEDTPEVAWKKREGRGVKVQILNDLNPDEDEQINGRFYEEETEDKAVVYEAFNMKTGKSYIGSAFSYEKHGDKPSSRYGAKGRFRRHWSNKSSNNPVIRNECPVFYEALRNSDILDWYIFTLKVGPKKHIKEYETRRAEKLESYNQKYGYNYLVGTKKPLDAELEAHYANKKADANVQRAKGGKMRQRDHSIGVPQNINYRATFKKKNGKIIKTKNGKKIKTSEGYFVQIKINGILYNKAFLSLTESMDVKLQKAINQLAEFKEQAANKQSSEEVKIIKKKT